MITTNLILYDPGLSSCTTYLAPCGCERTVYSNNTDDARLCDEHDQNDAPWYAADAIVNGLRAIDRWKAEDRVAVGFGWPGAYTEISWDGYITKAEFESLTANGVTLLVNGEPVDVNSIVFSDPDADTLAPPPMPPDPEPVPATERETWTTAPPRKRVLRHCYWHGMSTCDCTQPPRAP